MSSLLLPIQMTTLPDRGWVGESAAAVALLSGGAVFFNIIL
jgi:hypothetical protein